MAQLNENAFKALYGASGTTFPDNTTGQISEGDMRDFGRDIADSYVNKITDFLTGLSGVAPGINNISGLKLIVTTGASLSSYPTVIFRDVDNGNVLRVYVLYSGTDAESSPDIIRPNDYNGTTNQKVWKLAVVDASGGDFWPLDGSADILGNVTLAGNGFNVTLGQSGDRMGNFRVWSNGTARLDGVTAAGLQSDGDVDITSTSHGSIVLGASGHVITDNNATKKGLQTAASGYVTDPRSYTDKEYVDALIGANDAMQFKGVIDASSNPNYPAADAGHTYKISVAGKVGGASGKSVEAGDMIICTVDGSAAGNEATVGANWVAVQVNLDGAVIGPASSTSDNIPAFDGTTGKLLKDSGKAHSIDGTFAANSDNKIPTEKAVKTYADTKLPLAGGTMSGNIVMGSNKLTGLSAGTTAGESVRYEQVIGTQDLYIPAGAWTPRTSNGCAQITTYENATSKVNVDVLYFDSSAQEFAQFKISMPRNWNNGTITAKFHWMAPSGAGTVVWGMSGVALSDGDALSTSFGTRQSVSDAIGTTETIRSTSYTSAITIAGTPADADIIILQIDRDPADGSDNFNADAGLIGVTITITTDSGVSS
jgi:hypothetical protein